MCAVPLSLTDLSHLSRPALLLLGALVLLLIALPVSSALLGRRIHSLAATPRAKHIRYARSMLTVWLITLTAVYALRLHGQTPADVGLVPPRFPLEWLAGLVVVAGLALSSMRRETVDAAYAERMRRVIPLTTGDWIWFVPVAATAGLCEEFLYRGYALNVVTQLTGHVFYGVALSTIAFGLAHAYQGIRGIVGTAIIGALFAAIYLLTGSLWPCIIGHFAQDIVGAYLLGRRLPPERPPSVVTPDPAAPSPPSPAS
jgi:uncharacterized protein